MRDVDFNPWRFKINIILKLYCNVKNNIVMLFVYNSSFNSQDEKYVKYFEYKIYKNSKHKNWNLTLNRVKIQRL